MLRQRQYEAARRQFVDFAKESPSAVGSLFDFLQDLVSFVSEHKERCVGILSRDYFDYLIKPLILEPFIYKQVISNQKGLRLYTGPGNALSFFDLYSGACSEGSARFGIDEISLIVGEMMRIKNSAAAFFPLSPFNGFYIDRKLTIPLKAARQKLTHAEAYDAQTYTKVQISLLKSVELAISSHFHADSINVSNYYEIAYALASDKRNNAIKANGEFALISSMSILSAGLPWERKWCLPSFQAGRMSMLSYLL